MTEVSLNNYNSGFLLIYKPKNVTSTFVVGLIKRQLKPIFGRIKVGHGGTLDPKAEGVLPIAIGNATKLLTYVLSANKTYKFTLQFGAIVNTADSEGDIIAINNSFPTIQQIQQILPSFVGTITQIPPNYSAIKVNGERAYNLARADQIFTIEPRVVNVLLLEINEYNFESKSITFTSVVSKGTYIRTLGVDIAKSLGMFAYVSNLIRTRVNLNTNKELSSYSLNKVYNMKQYLEEMLVLAEEVLIDILAYSVSYEAYKQIVNGNLELMNQETEIRTILNKEILNGSLESLTVKILYEQKLICLLNYNTIEFKFLRIINNSN